MITHFIDQSANADWLREMRALEHDGDVEFDRHREPPRIVSRDFVTGCADEAVTDEVSA